MSKHKRKLNLRTLADPSKGICIPFAKDFFCELDDAGGEFNCTHLVYLDGEYQGTVFRLTPEDGWQYSVRGCPPCAFYFEDIKGAISALDRAKQADDLEWRNWLDELMFSPLLGNKPLDEDVAA